MKASKAGLKVSFSEGKDQTFDRILVAVGRVPNGKTLDADKAGVNVDERGFIRGRQPAAHERPRHLRDRRHRRRADARPQGHPRGQGRRRSDRGGAWRRIRRAHGSVGRLHRPRGRLDGPHRDRRQGSRASSTRRPPSPGPRPDARSVSVGPRAPPSCCSRLETNRLLGAGIVGVGAGDLIAETVLALEAGTERRGHRARDPPAPDAFGDDRVRRRDAGRFDHRPAAAEKAQRSRPLRGA